MSSARSSSGLRVINQSTRDHTIMCSRDLRSSTVFQRSISSHEGHASFLARPYTRRSQFELFSSSSLDAPPAFHWFQRGSRRRPNQCVTPIENHSGTTAYELRKPLTKL